MGWETFGTLIGGIFGSVTMPGPGTLAGGVIGNRLGAFADDREAPASDAGSDAAGKGGGTVGHDVIKRLGEGDRPDQGKAADAADEKNADLAKAVDRLAKLDEKSRATLKAIEDEGVAGKKALDSIQSDLDAKVKELGPRMDTAQGQQEFRDYALEKLTAAKEVLAKHNELAAQKAREAIELTKEYGEVGDGKSGEGKKPEGGGSTGGGDGGGSGSGGGGSSPEGSPAPAAAPGPQPGQQPMMPGMPFGGMPGMGGGFPGMGGGAPGIGGGGIPGLGDLGGLGAGSGAPKLDDGLGLGDHGNKPGEDKSGPSLTDPDKPAGPGEHKPGDPATPPPGDTTPAGDHPVTAAPAAHAGPNLSVSLPDGTTTTARTELGREVVTSMMANGSNVADEYAKKNIVLPPPGTPVIDAVSPSMLKAGDVGMWKDHYVTALGDNKVWVSGQVQSLESLGSSPDFLGWFDPTAKSGAAPAAPPAAPPAADPTAK